MTSSVRGGNVDMMDDRSRGAAFRVLADNGELVCAITKIGLE